jgi:rubrerythrin
VEATIERIRLDGAVENTLHNVIQTLSVKLDSAARYGLYAEDARLEGYDDCVALFSRLAEHEQRAIEDLKGCLRGHIGDL